MRGFESRHHLCAQVLPEQIGDFRQVPLKGIISNDSEGSISNTNKKTFKRVRNISQIKQQSSRHNPAITLFTAVSRRLISREQRKRVRTGSTANACARPFYKYNFEQIPPSHIPRRVKNILEYIDTFIETTDNRPCKIL